MTFARDLTQAPRRYITGFGFDVHRFDSDRPLILGGVTIPDAPGLAGHSDADVLLHALVDALLGAVGAGDIGIIVRAGDLGVKAFDRAALAEVECLALRHTFGDVEQDDVAHFLLRGEVGERAADHAGADKGDLLACHWG